MYVLRRYRSKRALASFAWRNLGRAARLSFRGDLYKAWVTLAGVGGGLVFRPGKSELANEPLDLRSAHLSRFLLERLQIADRQPPQAKPD
jgi:hypothetical protein